MLHEDWSMVALAAEFGFDRRDRHAVRLDAAVAAAFADQLVDDHALGRIGVLAALAAAALFGGAGLVVEQDVQPGVSRSSRCTRVELVAMVDLDPRREVAAPDISPARR